MTTRQELALALEDWYWSTRDKAPKIVLDAVLEATSLLRDIPIDGGGWRSINDAPKDGTRVLLTDGYNVTEGFWCVMPYGCGAARWRMMNGSVFTDPTYYQLMPLPPQEQSTVVAELATEINAGTAEALDQLQALGQNFDAAVAVDTSGVLQPLFMRPGVIENTDSITERRLRRLEERLARLEGRPLRN